MSEHAVLPPSSAARRISCPGSRELEARCPREESPEAREGTVAHWVALQLFRGVQIEAGTLASFNEDVVTEEMIEAAKMYVDCVQFTGGKTYIPPDGVDSLNALHLEEKIEISSIHPNCWGTPDAWCYHNNTLHIWDFKYGHSFVEVYENWQLIEYAAGIIEKIKQLKLTLDIDLTVRFCIVQPRSYHRDGPIREWIIKACNLRPYFNQLELAEHRAMQPDAECFPNPECKNCNGRHVCPALQRSALGVLEINEVNTPLELTPTAVGNELRILQNARELLDARITGLEENAVQLIRRGDRVPGYLLLESNKREQWSKPIEEVITLGRLFNVDLTKTTATITPQQAIAKGVPAEVIKKYSERPRGDLVLTPEDTKKTRKIFGGNE